MDSDRFRYLQEMRFGSYEILQRLGAQVAWAKFTVPRTLVGLRGRDQDRLRDAPFQFGKPSRIFSGSPLCPWHSTHPHIVTIYELGSEKGSTNIAYGTGGWENAP